MAMTLSELGSILDDMYQKDMWRQGKLYLNTINLVIP